MRMKMGISNHLWTNDEINEDENEIEFEEEINEEIISEDPDKVNDYIMKQQSFDIKGGRRCNTIHDGSYHLIHEEDKTIAGAAGADVDPTEADLVIDLAGLYSQSATQGSDFVRAGENATPAMAKKWEKLNSHVHSPPVMRIKWQDMGVPPVGIAFWKDLWDLLPKGLTIICCHGGHGRTGTALAAIMVVCLGYGPRDAIQEVRKYCSCAIETAGQEEYIYSLVEEC
tara:strand:+ start:186 stop:866 length:681 start_codon:yes stop_codon:yes gene_type:complete